MHDDTHNSRFKYNFFFFLLLLILYPSRSFIVIEYGSNLICNYDKATIEIEKKREEKRLVYNVLCSQTHSYKLDVHEMKI